jgi:hypothetical protein
MVQWSVQVVLVVLVVLMLLVLQELLAPPVVLMILLVLVVLMVLIGQSSWPSSLLMEGRDLQLSLGMRFEASLEPINHLRETMKMTAMKTTITLTVPYL